MSPSCEQATQSNTGMHVAGSGLHQPTAQSRIFERLFDVHSEAEDLSALSFWSAFAFGFSLETESLGGFETGLTGLLSSCLSRTDSAVVTPYSKQHAFSMRLPTARMISITTRLLEVACTTPRESMVAQTATSTNSQRRTQKWHREGSRMW